MEREDIRFFLTGSSSHLLSKELGTLLTGRHISFEIFPLSFKEFLKFRGVMEIEELTLLSQKRKIKNLLREYIEFGGFPEVVLEREPYRKETILKHYFEDILYRDVVERYRVRDIKGLKNLTFHYLTNFSNLMTYNRIKNSLKLPMDVIRNSTSYL